ncbi:hypothetical protein BDA96_04G355100 [Sorghum bicolor]|uniref:RING-type domain-containing protein n=2 Tax=Sorghum bicolor TaxID=4558 RepID=A0A921RAF4_SORBI|nr:RING-H2 finger protein ATL80 isoform X2 [Sorghum bicolor]KAG0535305.1 hypothetical protein BDA96_04G355100 [Sorghum bicolor]KXG31279.1 hypothetical protein SORBI_3004G332100 [Sorghum bicolor]|eukprot:XP_021314968.1 RING-H2 finger protein ATL80 isoform X2 [Sorghum bicolor]
MVIMAGMLPGVESARRRRVRQSSESGAARRPSLCLYAGGLGSSSSAAAAAASSKVWSGACGDTTAAMACAWMTTLGSDAREAKERLDHKLRGHRQPVVLKRHQTTSTRPPPAKPQDDATRGAGGSDGHHSATAPCGVLLHREVLPSLSSKPRKGGGCRFSWRRRPPAAESEAEAECAVCLEELRAGDVVARLPCAHRFHWSCAVPWVQAVSRCPVCRAHVHLAAGAGPTS